jgi:hypothetical protein
LKELTMQQEYIESASHEQKRFRAVSKLGARNKRRGGLY